jgi:hypothetical protein
VAVRGGGGCIGEPTAMDPSEGEDGGGCGGGGGCGTASASAPTTARNPFTKRALSPYNQALKHRLEDASWVCCSHYGLRLTVVRTATLLMRRLLVWTRCERLSCSSELWS